MKQKSNMRNTKLSYFITVPKIEDEGYLCFLEETDLPFLIKRIYYIFDVIEHAKRGFHAHKQTKQVLFCIKGSITMNLDNGKEREEFIMDKPNEGIFLNTLMWHEMIHFTNDAVLLVVASEPYDSSDYIRDYGLFKKIVSGESTI